MCAAWSASGSIRAPFLLGLRLVGSVDKVLAAGCRFEPFCEGFAGVVGWISPVVRALDSVVAAGIAVDSYGWIRIRLRESSV